MPEVSNTTLRDIFIIWFYVTVTLLDDIDKDNPVPLSKVIDKLATDGAGVIEMNDKNKGTVKHFYDGIQNNDGFGFVKAVLTSHSDLNGPWTIDPPHPNFKELKSVFIVGK